VSDRALVTGAAGFIGSHCCAALLRSGFNVVGLDNFDPFYARSIKEQGIAELRSYQGFRLVEGDIRDAATVARTLDGVSLVVHLAARAGIRPSLEDPPLYASVNIEGTTQLLEQCRLLGVKRFVFGSSSSVYGNATHPPFPEDAPALAPISPYAATKRAGELLCDVYRHLYQMRVASLRFFTVYGPRQRPDLAIHKFTRLIESGQAIKQFGDGSSERDYTHVDDILQGVLGAVRWVQDDQPAHEIFNLGESRTVSLKRLIALIAESLGVEPRIEYLPDQPGDVRRTCADISKARRVLGYDPQVSIEDGIPGFVDWFRAHHGTESAPAT
jgi:UDP-glucuronate 4-epimerase